MMPKAILITGATGNQGGAVIKALDAIDHAKFTVFALTRDTTSTASKTLHKRYPFINLVSGNLDAPGDIFNKIGSPVWGVFSVQTPFGKGASIEMEETQGKRLVTAALENGVKHFIYASVDRGGSRSDDGKPCPVPHFESKRQVELFLRSQAAVTEMQYTILRPVFFMDNLADDTQGKLIATAWRANVDPKRLQLVSISDIGYFAAQAFANPDEFHGRAISLAGDELSQEEASAIWRSQTGIDMPVGSRVLAWLLLKAVKDLRYMFTWFSESGYGADIALLKREHPGLQNFKAWVSSRE